MDKKYVIVAFVIIVSTLSFARSFLGLIGIIPWHIGYSDIFNYDRINPATAAQVPYVEKPVEYPVITGFFIYLMWLFGRNLLGYALLSYISLTLFAVITALFLYKLCSLLKIPHNRLWWFFALAPSMLLFNIFNWDMLAVMFMTLSVYYFYKEKPGLAALFIGLGFNAKLFPAVLLPIMFLKAGKKERMKMSLIFLAAFLVLNSYFIFNNYELWKATYSFHSIREPNIDSIWHLTGLSVSMVNSLSAALFLLFYLILIVNHKKFDFISMSFLSIALLLIFAKIFSPQYILWALPFFVLLPHLNKGLFYLLESANIIVFFTTAAWILSIKNIVLLGISNVFVIARAMLLVAIIFLSLRRLLQYPQKTKNNIND